MNRLILQHYQLMELSDKIDIDYKTGIVSLWCLYFSKHTGDDGKRYLNSHTLNAVYEEGPPLNEDDDNLVQIGHYNDPMYTFIDKLTHAFRTMKEDDAYEFMFDLVRKKEYLNRDEPVLISSYDVKFHDRNVKIFSMWDEWLFSTNGSPFFKTGISPKEILAPFYPYPEIYIGVNDVFAPAADYEDLGFVDDLSNKEIDLLYDLYKKFGSVAVAVWVGQKRGERPWRDWEAYNKLEEPVAKFIKEWKDEY